MSFDTYLQRARAHMTRGDFAAAASHYEALAQLAPDNAAVWRALGAARHQAHDAVGAESAFARAMVLDPSHPGGALGLGHALRALGAPDRAAQSYRRALKLKPDSGEAWWSLAALKSVAMRASDTEALEALARAPAAATGIFYALGRVYEDTGRYDEAFAAWTEGGRRRLLEQPYDPERDREFAARMRALSDHDLARLKSVETGAPRPIFIVGLPRSGSTLMEQILAAHPDVVAADEAPFLGQAAATLGSDFPLNVAGLSAADLAAAGAAYRRALAARAGACGMVVDKNPNNLWLIGFIACALPDAVIIHTRRDPLDLCVSAFKQMFAAGFPFTSKLEHLGFYCRLASGFIDDWNARLPGLVHTFHYEALIGDQEGETRRLLDVCGLNWNPACLAFHEHRRAVHTASAEQVSRPLYRASVGQWRRFNKHLGPLRAALDGGTR
jgi:tetratricopeptide (TPR) repeat protein